MCEFVFNVEITQLTNQVKISRVISTPYSENQKEKIMPIINNGPSEVSIRLSNGHRIIVTGVDNKWDENSNKGGWLGHAWQLEKRLESLIADIKRNARSDILLEIEKLVKESEHVLSMRK